MRNSAQHDADASARTQTSSQDSLKFSVTIDAPSTMSVPAKTHTTNMIMGGTPEARAFADAVRTMLSAPKAKVQESMAAEKAERATKRGKRITR